MGGKMKSKTAREKLSLPENQPLETGLDSKVRELVNTSRPTAGKVLSYHNLLLSLLSDELLHLLIPRSLFAHMPCTWTSFSFLIYLFMFIAQPIPKGSLSQQQHYHIPFICTEVRYTKNAILHKSTQT